MDKSFKDAVANTAPENSAQLSTDLTLTTDWQGTLASGRAYNFALFNLLCDAHRAGHRVIITSTSAAAVIRDVLELATEFGEIAGHDILVANKFEIITKSDLMALTSAGKVSVDIAFDDEEISKQTKVNMRDGKVESLNYAQPLLEIRMGADFATSPLSLDDVRTYMDALVRDRKAAPPAGAPAPAPH